MIYDRATRVKVTEIQFHARGGMPNAGASSQLLRTAESIRFPSSAKVPSLSISIIHTEAVQGSRRNVYLIFRQDSAGWGDVPISRFIYTKPILFTRNRKNWT